MGDEVGLQPIRGLEQPARQALLDRMEAAAHEVLPELQQQCLAARPQGMIERFQLRLCGLQVRCRDARYPHRRLRHGSEEAVVQVRLVQRADGSGAADRGRLDGPPFRRRREQAHQPFVGKKDVVERMILVLQDGPRLQCHHVQIPREQSKIGLRQAAEHPILVAPHGARIREAGTVRRAVADGSRPQSGVQTHAGSGHGVAPVALLEGRSAVSIFPELPWKTIQLLMEFCPVGIRVSFRRERDRSLSHRRLAKALPVIGGTYAESE
jgi:hypothetical protein